MVSGLILLLARDVLRCDLETATLVAALFACHPVSFPLRFTDLVMYIHIPILYISDIVAYIHVQLMFVRANSVREI